MRAGWFIAVVTLVLGAALPAFAQEAGFTEEPSPSPSPTPAEITPAAVPPSSYETARARAVEAASAGRFADAAAALEGVVREYPNDFALRLDFAYYLLRAQEFEKAAVAYRAALAISPAHPDAQAGLSDATLGLAWRAFKAGRADDARAGFESVISGARNVGSAREGLALVAPPTRFVPRLFGQGWSFLNDSSRGSLWSITVGGDLWLSGHYLVSGYYRHIGDATAPANAPAGYYFAQEEGHLRLGIEHERWGVALLGSMASFPAWTLVNGATGRDYAAIVGGQVRFVKWATFTAAPVWMHYGDSELGQLDLAAVLPITPLFSLAVGARVQLVSDGLHGAGRVEARLHRARWLLAAAAQVGSEWRPYDVETRSIYNLNQLLLYGAELRGWAPLTAWLDGYASLGWERWRTVIGTPTDSDALRFTLGLSASF